MTSPYYSPIIFPFSAVVFAPPPLSSTPQRLFNDFIDVGLSVDGGNRNTASKAQWINPQNTIHNYIGPPKFIPWKWFADPNLTIMPLRVAKSTS